ncbi:MAG: RNA 2',3'-cyclic phosphodiesterase [Candidatus Aquicultor sp.]
MLRLFIGIELPLQIKHMLNDISLTLKNQLDSTARWVAKDNIHLTLKFLGDTSQDKLDEIESAIGDAIQEFRKFYFTLGEMGAFPSARKARVIWVGVHHGAPELIELGKAIEKALEPLGYKRESKEFKPHITLARLKFPQPVGDALSRIPPETFPGRVINVDGITIFQSHLKPTGSEYTMLRYVNLNP